MDWRKDAKMTHEQTGHPVVWHSTLQELGFEVAMPRLHRMWFNAFWGDDTRSQRLKTFGHKGDRMSPHFLCTRGGKGMHTDPGFSRYALQVQLWNDGFIVHGLEDRIEDMPIFLPGLVILLDTWSPHTVVRDPRLAQQGDNKLLAGMDFKGMPDIGSELPELVEWIGELRT
jgi:hypothetical protein